MLTDFEWPCVVCASITWVKTFVKVTMEKFLLVAICLKVYFCVALSAYKIAIWLIILKSFVGLLKMCIIQNGRNCMMASMWFQRKIYFFSISYADHFLILCSCCIDESIFRCSWINSPRVYETQILERCHINIFIYTHSYDQCHWTQNIPENC